MLLGSDLPEGLCRLSLSQPWFIILLRMDTCNIQIQCLIQRQLQSTTLTFTLIQAGFHHAVFHIERDTELKEDGILQDQHRFSKAFNPTE